MARKIDREKDFRAPKAGSKVPAKNATAAKGTGQMELIIRPQIAGFVRSLNHKTPDTWYTISKLAVGIWQCSCPAFIFSRLDDNGKRKPCKHQLMLFQGWRTRNLNPSDIRIVNSKLL